MTPERPPIASVEEVREELRRLGYLDSGLDRFVLAGTASASPAAAAARAALRVGVAGGVLFGAVLTLAAAGLDLRLLAEPRDLAVLGVYLVGVAGAVTAGAAFLGGLAAAWAGRRFGHRPGPTLPRNVGLALALLGLGYLALWWRSHAAGAAWPVQAAVFALGLGLSLLLARFGSLAAVAVLSAEGAGHALPQASLSRHRLLPLLVAAALLAGVGAAASYLAARADEGAPDFAVVPTGLRVVVVGVDGLERQMTEQLIGRGEMPHLAALLAASARARLRAEPEQVPAIVWTTIATGRGPEAHGIRATGARRLAGMRTPVALDAPGRLGRSLGAALDLLRITRAQPATSVLRGVKTFWNVASEKGLRVGVVNWWATWPADPLNGYVVTDRAFFKLEKGEAPDREVSPPADFARLREALPAEADRARRMDRFHVEAARLLDDDHPPDVEALYLPGLDITTMQQLGEASASDVATLDERLSAVRAYYRFVDGLIGAIAERQAAGSVLVLVGDPGRLARRSGEPAEGLLALAGGVVRPGDLGVASERDVAPTVLHLAGLPRSRELDGKVLDGALRAEFREAHPVRTVATYGRRPREGPAESSFDREMLEELRSLGYVQ